MGIISWIVLGGIAGWLASVIMRRTDRSGCITNVVVGIIGAFIGGFVMSQLGHRGVTGFNFRSFLVAVLGSVILLAVVGLFTSRKK
jgi:uncharacterized membrane protein YeaQ/YmgE (transglycosylase-associated protein family)